MIHAAHDAFAAIATPAGVARPCVAAIAPPVTSPPRAGAGLAPPPAVALG